MAEETDVEELMNRLLSTQLPLHDEDSSERDSDSDHDSPAAGGDHQIDMDDGGGDDDYDSAQGGHAHLDDHHHHEYEELENGVYDNGHAADDENGDDQPSSGDEDSEEDNANANNDDDANANNDDDDDEDYVLENGEVHMEDEDYSSDETMAAANGDNNIGEEDPDATDISSDEAEFGGHAHADNGEETANSGTDVPEDDEISGAFAGAMKEGIPVDIILPGVSPTDLEAGNKIGGLKYEWCYEAADGAYFTHENYESAMFNLKRGIHDFTGRVSLVPRNFTLHLPTRLQEPGVIRLPWYFSQFLTDRGSSSHCFGGQ